MLLPPSIRTRESVSLFTQEYYVQCNDRVGFKLSLDSSIKVFNLIIRSSKIMQRLRASVADEATKRLPVQMQAICVLQRDWTVIYRDARGYLSQLEITVKMLSPDNTAKDSFNLRWRKILRTAKLQYLLDTLALNCVHNNIHWDILFTKRSLLRRIILIDYLRLITMKVSV